MQLVVLCSLNVDHPKVGYSGDETARSQQAVFNSEFAKSVVPPSTKPVATIKFPSINTTTK